MEMLAQYWRYLLTLKFQSMSNLCSRVLSMHSTHSPTSKQQCMIQIFSAHKCRFRSIYFYIYTIIHISMYVIFFRKVLCWIATGDYWSSFFLRVKCHILLLVPKSNSSGIPLSLTQILVTWLDPRWIRIVSKLIPTPVPDVCVVSQVLFIKLARNVCSRSKRMRWPICTWR